jgi:predicted PurR-regulated permease PerM
MDEQKSLISWQKRVYLLVFFSLLLGLVYLLMLIGENIKEILIAFSLAIVFNYLLARPVEFLTRFIHVRLFSVLIIFLSFVAGIVLGAFYLIPIIGEQIKALQNAIPRLFLNLYQAIDYLNMFLSNYQIHLPIEGINRPQILNAVLEALKLVDPSDFGNFIGDILLGSVTTAMYTIVITVITVYLLVDGNRVWQMLLDPFSKRLSAHLNEIKKRIDLNMSAFVFGQFQIATLTTLVMLVTYLVLGIPYGILLGLAQILEILPVLGTWIAIVPCITIIMFSSGLSKGLIALVVYLFYTQFIRDNIIAPRIMGDAIGFHPVAVIFGLFVGAKLGGAVGVLLALPALIIMGSILGYIVETSRLKVQFTN